MKKLKIAFKMILERTGLWLLHLSGTKIIVYPIHMELYREEIESMCLEEEQQELHTDDILGSGYFRARRVMSKMRKKYPFLSVRDLWKAVDICSEDL